jgi:hypothetical protein
LACCMRRLAAAAKLPCAECCRSLLEPHALEADIEWWAIS